MNDKDETMEMGSLTRIRILLRVSQSHEVEACEFRPMSWTTMQLWSLTDIYVTYLSGLIYEKKLIIFDFILCKD